MENHCDHCGEYGDSVAHAEECPLLLRAEIDRLRASLAEAKRLGLEACEFVHSAIRNAPDANSTGLGDMSASAMGHDNADRIAAELEAL